MTENPNNVAQQADLLRKHQLAMNDLDEYSVFLDSWQSIIDDTSTDGLPDYRRFSDFEDYASHAVHNFLQEGTGQTATASQSRLESHKCTAITTTGDGLIRQTNLAAHTAQELVVGKTLAECGIDVVQGEDISTLLAEQKPDTASTFHLVQARNTRLDAFVTLAISRVQNPIETEPLYLILFIAPPDTKAATAMLTQKFKLTPIEAEISKAFLDGIPLRDIAKNRKRSYTTIRNQFQSVLDKSGCVSQTALYRLAFSLLQFVEQTARKPDPAYQSYTRTMALPRPNGRVVEVALSGDETGQPILSLPTLSGHAITPEIESRLYTRGILLISVMRPGFGDTSPPLPNQSLYDCVAGDIRAILDSLEIEKCPCIARYSAARSFYNMLARLPDRITHGVLASGMIPQKYVAGHTLSSKWTTALMSASVLSYPIAKLILGTGNNLLMRSKGATFLYKMYPGSKTDHAILDDEDVVSIIKTGVQHVTKQGLRPGVEEIVKSYENWEDDLHDIKTPVTLYHGRFDQNVPIAGVENFVGDHSCQLRLIEEPSGGGMLSFSHINRILDLALKATA